MATSLHGQACTILSFFEPDGELDSLALIEGTLHCGGKRIFFTSHDGSDTVLIPEHLAALIQDVTDEHRECMPELTTPYLLHVFVDRHIVEEEAIDLQALLDEATGESARD